MIKQYLLPEPPLLSFTPEKLAHYLKSCGFALPLPSRWLQGHRRKTINAYELLIGAQLSNPDNMPLDLFLLMMDQLPPDDIRTCATQYPLIGDALKGKNFPKEKKKQLEIQLHNFWRKKFNAYFPRLADRYQDTNYHNYENFFNAYDLNYSYHPNSYKHCYDAIATNNLTTLIELLNENKITVKDFENPRYNFLSAMIYRNRTNLLDYILNYLSEQKTDINQFLLNKQPRLVYDAIKSKNIEIMNILLQFINDINQFAYNSNAPLFAAVDSEDIEIVKLLIKHNADVNRAVNGTPLHLATRQGNLAIVELLLKHGADPSNNANDNQQSCLHIAFENNHLEIIQLLLKHRANVNAVDKFGCTPLHAAAKNGSTNCINLLLAHQADANALDKIKQTPLAIAIKLSADSVNHRLAAFILAKHKLNQIVLVNKPHSFMTFKPALSQLAKQNAQTEFMGILDQLIKAPKLKSIHLSPLSHRVLNDKKCEMYELYLQLQPLVIFDMTQQKQIKNNKH